MELMGKHDEVEKLCRDVIKEAPTNLVALNNLAWQLGQHKNTAAEALPLVERAIENHGPRPELLDTRAVANLNLGKIDLALRDFERVVNEAPTPARLFHLTRALERAKHIAAAQATLREATAKGLTVQQLHPAEHAEFQRVSLELAKRP
jgi:cellulose synthase operon protein C